MEVVLLGERLVAAQAICGPRPGQAGLVPALQPVWPTGDGHWPGELPWREARRVQERFGAAARR